MTVGLSHRLRLIHPNKYLMWCPGCARPHVMEIGSPATDGRTLGYDGDHVNPTFTPAFRVTVDEDKVCQYELRGGRLDFDDGCWHDLAGKSIELPHFPLS